MPVQREMSTEVPRPHIENWFTTREERVTHVTAKKGKLISQVQYLLESAQLFGPCDPVEKDENWHKITRPHGGTQ